MDTVTTYILFVIFSACFARHSSDILEHHQKHIKNIDIRFYLVFQRLITRTPLEGLNGVGSLFSYIASIAATVYFVGLLIGSAATSWSYFIVIILLYSTAGWLAIRWFTQPKRYLLIFLKEMIFLSITPMIMPLTEALTGVPLTQAPYSTLMQIPYTPEIFGTNNIWIKGLTISGLMFSAFFMYWFAMTAISAPIALSGWILMITILKIGKFIDEKWRERALTPICFIALMLVSAYGHFN